METKKITLKDPKVKDIKKEITKIAKYIASHPEEKILVAYMFAGHGQLVDS